MRNVKHRAVLHQRRYVSAGHVPSGYLGVLTQYLDTGPVHGFTLVHKRKARGAPSQRILTHCRAIRLLAGCGEQSGLLDAEKAREVEPLEEGLHDLKAIASK